ncbi:MAG: cupin domain-containing protein [Dehalococcoidia bacterium]
MRIFRSEQTPFKAGDTASFVGPVHTRLLGAGQEGTPVNVYHVRFESGGRTNWHSHSGAQWLFVTEGRVRIQLHGEQPQDLEVGDAVIIFPGEKHWHGAAPGGDGVHLAVNVNAETTWLEPVDDAEYEPTFETGL